MHVRVPVVVTGVLCNRAQDVKNENRKWIFSVFHQIPTLTHQIPTLEGKRIHCVIQKPSIKRNIELQVAIHEVHDGQRSRCLS